MDYFSGFNDKIFLNLIFLIQLKITTNIKIINQNKILDNISIKLNPN